MRAASREPNRSRPEGLAAWRQNDFDEVEALLDAHATWRAPEPGEWDCVGRDAVVALLRERHAQGFAADDFGVSELGRETVLVVSHPARIGGPDWPDENAMVVTVREGRIVSIQDHWTREAALEAVR